MVSLGTLTSMATMDRTKSSQLREAVSARDPTIALRAKDSTSTAADTTALAIYFSKRKFGFFNSIFYDYIKYNIYLGQMQTTFN